MVQQTNRQKGREVEFPSKRFLQMSKLFADLEEREIWLELTLKPRRVLSTVLNMEAESRRFYQDALNKVTSADIRQLLDNLAAAEEDHQDLLVDKTKEKKKTGALSAEQYSR